MSSAIISSTIQESQNKPFYNQSAMEIWLDMLSYSVNLKGNWMTSQDIFNNKIAPKALNNPEEFASSLEEVVKVTGLKVNNKARFSRTIRVLKNLKNNAFELEQIKIVLTDLLSSDLKEPRFVQAAVTHLAT